MKQPSTSFSTIAFCLMVMLFLSLPALANDDFSAARQGQPATAVVAADPCNKEFVSTDFIVDPQLNSFDYPGLFAGDVFGIVGIPKQDEILLFVDDEPKQYTDFSTFENELNDLWDDSLGPFLITDGTCQQDWAIWIDGDGYIRSKQ